MARKISSDKLLFTITVALVMFGLIMIYSASAVIALEQYGSPYYYVLRQIIWCVLSFGAMMIMMNIPYRTWNNRLLVFSLIGISAVLLVAVLFMPAIRLKFQ